MNVTGDWDDEDERILGILAYFKTPKQAEEGRECSDVSRKAFES